MEQTISLDEFFEHIGGKDSDGYKKWIDALARNIGTMTDPDEIQHAIFNKRNTNSSDIDYTVELTGGDPINNQGSQDVAAYNSYLLANYIDFDYVDKDGNSCIYGVAADKQLARLNDIVALKVIFKANPETGNVQAPYYTNNNSVWTESAINLGTQTAALPLENAFRVEIATRADQVEVARYNFTFELTQPTLDITRVSGEKAIWVSDTELNLYGDKVTKEGEVYMYAPFYEAFSTAYAKEYSKFVPNASYYELSLKARLYCDGWFLGDDAAHRWDAAINPKPLTDIDYSVNASEWGVAINASDVVAKTKIPIAAEYHFYGVYPATKEQVPNFTMRFVSLLGDAKEVKTKDADYTVNNVSREVILTDADFTLTDALDNTFYLFNGVKADGTIDNRSDMNQRQGFEEGKEGFEEEFKLAMGTTGSVVTNVTVEDMNGDPIKNSDGSEVKAVLGKDGKATVDENGTITFTDDDVTAGYYENDFTKTNGWAAATNESDNIIITNLPAKQAVKPNYAAIPGGIMIQLPASIGTTEPVVLKFELKDVFGATKTLSVIVKANK